MDTWRENWARRPKRSRNKMICFRVSPEEMSELEKEASRRRLNLSELMRAALVLLFEYNRH